MLAKQDRFISTATSLGLTPAEQHVPRSDGTERQASANPYAELKGLIKQAGLFEKQPVYYTYKIALTLGAFALSLGLLLAPIPFSLQLLNAVFLAIVFTQVGFLLHDVCHRALARNARQNAFLGLFFGNVLTGISRAWWSENHNAHHSHPNEIDLDPNIDIPILAYTEEQALSKRGIARFVVAHQRFFLFPIFCLQGFNMMVQSAVFLRRSGDARLIRTEAPLLVLHYLLYAGVILVSLGLVKGLIFFLVHQALVGLYAGSVFAPNHKGMPVLESGANIDFLHQQVLTSRNVIGSPLTDFWYGGLNYQIEHHLFPTLPRNRQRKAQGIVKAFCSAHRISYHETAMIASYREILQHFREVSAVLHV